MAQILTFAFAFVIFLSLFLVVIGITSMLFLDKL